MHMGLGIAASGLIVCAASPVCRQCIVLRVRPAAAHATHFALGALLRMPVLRSVLLASSVLAGPSSVLAPARRAPRPRAPSALEGDGACAVRRRGWLGAVEEIGEYISEFELESLFHRK